MAQAAFPFDSSSTLPAPAARTAPRGAHLALAGAAGQPRTALDACGTELGWDHAHYQLTPPLALLHADNPVRHGWQAGRAVFGGRTLKASPAVRQWLALRVQAWREGQAVEGVQVTPNLLAQMAAAATECPVSRLPLGAEPDDIVVLRLNPAAAYAAGNLALVHRRVAEAAGTLGCEALLALAQQVAAGEIGSDGQLRGLCASAWQRLAVLASCATPLPHARAASLPLAVLPANRLRVINPVQALQVMLTLQFTAAGYARRLLGLAALLPGADARQAFQIFMHTLLSRRLAVGVHAPLAEVRRAIEDSWGDALVQRRWQRLALRLGAADCELLLQRAAQRGLVVGGGRWISAESATEGWALPGADSATAADAAASPVQAGAAGLQAARLAASPWLTPGSTRKRGSQKLAS